MALDLGTTEPKSRMWPMLTILGSWATLFSNLGKFSSPCLSFCLLSSPVKPSVLFIRPETWEALKKFVGLGKCDYVCRSCLPDLGEQLSWNMFCSHFHWWRSGTSSTETSKLVPDLQPDSGFCLPNANPEAILLIGWISSWFTLSNRREFGPSSMK